MSTSMIVIVPLNISGILVSRNKGKIKENIEIIFLKIIISRFQLCYFCHRTCWLFMFRAIINNKINTDYSEIKAFK